MSKWSLFPSLTNMIAIAEQAVNSDAIPRRYLLSNDVLSITSPEIVCTHRDVKPIKLSAKPMAPSFHPMPTR